MPRRAFEELRAATGISTDALLSVPLQLRSVLLYHLLPSPVPLELLAISPAVSTSWEGLSISVPQPYTVRYWDFPYIGMDTVTQRHERAVSRGGCRLWSKLTSVGITEDGTSCPGFLVSLLCDHKILVASVYTSAGRSQQLLQFISVALSDPPPEGLLGLRPARGHLTPPSSHPLPHSFLNR